MTNWEKWKSELTPEKYAELLCAYHGEMWQYAACPYCPIDGICNGGLYGDECKKPILAWANVEADSDGGEGDDFIKWNKNKEKRL